MTVPLGGDVREVRLITGDVVRWGLGGRVASIVAGPRPDGSIPRFSVTMANSHTFVVPSDVLPMLDVRLDRQLFDVDELAVMDRADGLVPVIVTLNGSGESEDGISEATWASLGIQPGESLTSIAAQVGLVEASASGRPAASWGLLDALRSGGTMIDKIWLDGSVSVSAPTGVASGTPNADDAAGVPPWMSLIGADQAHSAGFDGRGVTIAVVDSGIDAAHPDLVGQIAAARDFSESGSTDDASGHGTFVASEIAGTGAASGGEYAGVAPGARLLNVRVLDDDGYGADSHVLAGLEWAAQQGADIINVSMNYFGGYDDGSSLMDQVMNQLSQEYGCLFVVAAGNDGAPQTVSAPATAGVALAVGATYEDGQMAWFSSGGPRRGDGAVKPELVAPGAGNLIVDAMGDPVYGAYGPATTGLIGARAGTAGYTSTSDGWSGTSMAAPLVAGAAAILKQAHPSLKDQGLRAALMGSAQPLSDSSTVFDHGAGLLSIPHALAQSVTTAPAALNLGALSFHMSGRWPRPCCIRMPEMTCRR